MDIKLLSGESKFIEYKREYTKTLLKTVSAFANYHDGYIILGLNDAGISIGVNKVDETRLSIENAINDTIDPKPYYEINSELIEGQNIVILKVFKGDHTPYTYNNKTYTRMDTSTVQVDRRAYSELILLGRNQSYETISSSNQDLEFKEFSDELKDKLKIRELTEDLLITLGLKVTGDYNNAAALLSDNNPLESSYTQLVAYEDSTVKNIKDKQTLKNISILKQYKYCMDFYRKHINISEVIKGPYRETIGEVPLVAYREAIANAIIHRDYSREVDVRVEVFSNRIEIVSPGGLPIGILEEEYRDGKVSVPRNKILADIFLRLKIIEKLATGIRRIKEYYQEYDTKPEFRITSNSITVILPKVNRDDQKNEEYINPILSQLNDNEYRIYRLLKHEGAKKRQEIEVELGLKKSQTNELIRKLRDYDLIAQIGNGRSTQYIIPTNTGR